MIEMFKKISLFLGLGLVALIFLNVTAQTFDKAPSKNFNTINWLTWEEARALSKKDAQAGLKPKKVYVDVYTDWCGWCKRMDANTFGDAAVIQYMSDNFYMVKLNAERNVDIQYDDKTVMTYNSSYGRKGAHELAVKLLDGKMGYPSSVFLDEKFERIQTVSGYLEPGQFNMIASYFSGDFYLNTPWDQYEKKYTESKSK